VVKSVISRGEKKEKSGVLERYDDNRNVTQRTDSPGGTLDYVYDTTNKLTSEQFSGTTSIMTVTYQYEAAVAAALRAGYKINRVRSSFCRMLPSRCLTCSPSIRTRFSGNSGAS
jgi:hypothetical protein